MLPPPPPVAGKGTLVNVSHRANHGWVYAATVKHGEQASDPPSEGTTFSAEQLAGWVPHAVAKRVSLCRVAADWPEEGAGTLGLLKGDLIAVSKEAERGWAPWPTVVTWAALSSKASRWWMVVTGMSNLEVAQYLLQHGLEGLDGVLFLNERNERVSLAALSAAVTGAALDAPGSLGIHQTIHRDSLTGAAKEPASNPLQCID
eukprot:Skav234821  [mRNA]  locus=scaffold69:861037:866226:- [translate_table: standard]